MVDISIAGVVRITISEIENYEPDEDDEDEEPFYRTLTIETSTGTVEIELNATSEDALDLLEEDEDGEE